MKRTLYCNSCSREYREYKDNQRNLGFYYFHPRTDECVAHKLSSSISVVPALKGKSTIMSSLLAFKYFVNGFNATRAYEDLRVN